MTRGFERQVTEPQNRVSTLNRYTQLSMLETVRVGNSLWVQVLQLNSNLYNTAQLVGSSINLKAAYAPDVPVGLLDTQLFARIALD